MGILAEVLQEYTAVLVGVVDHMFSEAPLILCLFFFFRGSRFNQNRSYAQSRRGLA
nr:hypothetical protein Iba_scaffold1587056CG0010 [Ipomoea batatas]